MSGLPCIPLASSCIQYQRLQFLREQMARLEEAWHRSPRLGTVSTGWPEFDRMLPSGGFLWGSLVEWLSPGDGSGVMSLALRAVASACSRGSFLIIFDSLGEFYPLGAFYLGIPPENLVIIRPKNERDKHWALVQTLRGAEGCIVVASLQRLDSLSFRRLQLAAERGGSLGVFIRPPGARPEPSWAEVRLWAEPISAKKGTFAGGLIASRRWQIQILRCRGKWQPSQILEIELDAQTPTVRCFPQLAHPEIFARVTTSA